MTRTRLIAGVAFFILSLTSACGDDDASSGDTGPAEEAGLRESGAIGETACEIYADSFIECNPALDESSRDLIIGTCIGNAIAEECGECVREQRDRCNALIDECERECTDITAM
ncbi:MAG: hypothetical protein AAF938_12850 [Myxococcota bacterium]